MKQRPAIIQRITALLSGICLVFSFAPFHLPGFSFLSLACLFALIQNRSIAYACGIGFVFGLGFFGTGVSWVFISIRDYGHLHTLLAVGLTFLFVAYLALYSALGVLMYRLLAKPHKPALNGLLFSTTWCLSEYLRAHTFGGFPWLMLGFGQLDSPLGHLLPCIGVLGVSGVTCYASTLLYNAFIATHTKRRVYLLGFVGLVMSPLILAPCTWMNATNQQLSVGVIQANLSMRDKWDETLFWHILDHYQQAVEAIHADIIVMPESAIPVPSHYVSDYLEKLDNVAQKTHTALLLGIPQPTIHDTSLVYNALLGLGHAHGIYFKQHLVAFGEFMPKFLIRLSTALNLPQPNLIQGPTKQALLTVHDHPIASLICYELAYPELLRQQLPLAEWIVSISDDGWFGHSLAVYQHLQMAQVLSKQSARFQIVSNNDGLSSVIDASGKITHALPAFRAGILQASLQPNTQLTPWITYGDTPMHWMMGVIMCCGLVYRFTYRILNHLKSPKFSVAI